MVGNLVCGCDPCLVVCTEIKSLSSSCLKRDSHGNVFHQGAAALVGAGALLGHAGHGGVVAAEVNCSIFANWLRITLAVALKKCKF